VVSVPTMIAADLQMQHVDRVAITGTAGDVASHAFYIRSTAERAIHACSKLTNLLDELSNLAGSGTRVCEMLDVLDALHERHESDSLSISHHSHETATGTEILTSPPTLEPPAFTFTGVDIVTPAGECVAHDLTISHAANRSLMVTGPNGSGKTSFFRVLAGLWPLATGSLRRPPPGQVFLVPQRVYSVLGSLADQVTYPAHIDPKVRTAEETERLLAILKQVNVEMLVERHGWDSVKPWEHTLSLGEQQRIGLARLLYHRPAFGVLDECTDAVSADDEEGLYRTLHDANVSCITISKRLTLTDFHQRELSFGEPTLQGWRVRDL